MDKPINGDKYVRTLSHYLRTNQRRLLPVSALEQQQQGGSVRGSPLRNNHQDSSTSGSGSSGARSFVTPSDPMAAAYSGMVNSLWSMGTAVVNTITPTVDSRSSSPGQDGYTGSWDGTGTIPVATNPQLYLQAQLKSPIFPLDLYYLLYLLDRFEQVGIEIEGWDGSTPRAVGDSNPRTLNHHNGNGNGNGNNNNNSGMGSHPGSPVMPNSSSYSSFPPPTATGSSTRPQSIRSFSSTALSTLTLITGWKQWSNAAASTPPVTITDDIHFVHSFLKKIPGLRLVAKIPPGFNTSQAPGMLSVAGNGGKGKIEGYGGEAILQLLNYGQSHELGQEQPLLLPLAATFSSLTHLELHKIPPQSMDGWEKLMTKLRSLVIAQSGIEDVYDVLVTAVVESERRRRIRTVKEKHRAQLIRQEQREALKDATLVSQGRRAQRLQQQQQLAGSSTGSLASAGSGSPGSSVPSSPSLSLSGAEEDRDWTTVEDNVILDSLKMWPQLRHVSFSDNSLPALTSSESFQYTPEVVNLDLSHNLLLSPPAGLIHLHNLQSLNLSHNMIVGVHTIYQVLGNIAVLDLRGNRLESLCGLERLWNLEKVDVRENQLKEAAEVGRLAALPGIREVWSEKNPFCATQPKYRLEILAVFKANGHDLLLDGMFASFTEKRTLVQMSPSAFSTTISSINNVNLAHIPAATAPTATFAKGLSASGFVPATSPSAAASSTSMSPSQATGSNPSESQLRGASDVNGRGKDNSFGYNNNNSSNNNPSSPRQSKDEPLKAALSPKAPPVTKLVKKKLVKASKRVQRVVNLDSDHEEDEDRDSEDGGGGHDDYYNATKKSSHVDSSILGSPVQVSDLKPKKKVVKKTKAVATEGQEAGVDATGGEALVETKKKKKKEGTGLKKKKKAADVTFGDSTTTAATEGGDDDVDHANCKDGQHVHVHRLAQLEESMAHLQVNNNEESDSHHHPHARSHRPHDDHHNLHVHHGLHHGRAASPLGLMHSSSDEAGSGAENYRRKIEAMRNEAGSNWLKVLAEMDSSSNTTTTTTQRNPPSE
ncbi:hypothetical protein EMPS_03675 [Entomortierella parvispora]|uniref:Leucine rich repeat domain containing protein n=1 Tax=Entomortierella parvispora TaxID=205924 RepID=A0A9P3H726_9FUNG|nr:hypothetical protein EMPS_03675 [Entomortierella parvispora]